MSRYRKSLPQLGSEPFVTDGGLETTLIFHEGMELREFAAFELLASADGCETLRKYFATYVAIARRFNIGFILESATWRASADWGSKLGYSEHELRDLNRQAIALVGQVRDEYETADSPMVISGCVGPRGDGYEASQVMSTQESRAYHAAQIETFAETDADLVTGVTMTSAEEAAGIALVARSVAMPVVLSFTVETDGRLPSGESLRGAIEAVDDATDCTPAYYMINCAHPTHFTAALDGGGQWLERIRGIRANASSKSHAELDEAEELDDGNPTELGAQYGELKGTLNKLTVLGGCCGTDHRHIEEICKAALPLW